MAVSIGKRKREQNDDGSDAGSGDEDAMRALFQKAFEAKFKPLPPKEPQNDPDQQCEAGEISENSASSEEWDGLSDEDEPVQIISHNESSPESPVDQAHERRSFMVSRSKEHLEQHC